MSTPTISSFTGTGGPLGIKLDWSGTNINTYDISRSYYITHDNSGNESVKIGLPSTVTSYIDLDVNLNGWYEYYIVGHNSTTSTANKGIGITFSRGIPYNLSKSYNYSNNTYKLGWLNTKIFVDTANNLPFPDNSGTYISWDISCQRWDFGGTSTVFDQSSVIITGVSGESVINKEKSLSNSDFTSLTDFLKTDCSYNFFIRADYSNNIMSEKSSYSNVLTLDLTAEIPSNLQVNLSDSSSNVNFSWNSTTLPGIPDSYDISFSDTSDNSGVLLGISGGTSSKIGGRNYVPSQYNTVVRAKYKNNMGYSKWSSPISFTTPYYSPENFTVTALNSSDISSVNLITDVSYNKLEWKDLCGNVNGWEIAKTIIDASGTKYDSSYNLSNPADVSYNDDVSMNSGVALPQIYQYKVRALYEDSSGIWTDPISLDIGWQVPSGINVSYEQKGKAAVYGVFKWDAITHPYNNAFLNPTLFYVTYKVRINNIVYLAPNPTFSIYLAPGCGKTFVEIRAVYVLNTYIAMSSWSAEIFAENPADLYCNNSSIIAKNSVNLLAFGFNSYGSSSGSYKRRYAQAIKNIRGASNFKCD